VTGEEQENAVLRRRGLEPVQRSGSTGRRRGAAEPPQTAQDAVTRRVRPSQGYGNDGTTGLQAGNCELSNRGFVSTTRNCREIDKEFLKNPANLKRPILQNHY
jgi:hypothetical protein